MGKAKDIIMIWLVAIAGLTPSRLHSEYKIETSWMNILQPEERRLIFMIRHLPVIQRSQLLTGHHTAIMFFTNIHLLLEGVDRDGLNHFLPNIKFLP